jgi:hypothetical protein
MTFPYMHTMFFDNIHPSITSFYPSPFPFNLPSSPPYTFDLVFGVFPLTFTNERK